MVLGRANTIKLIVPGFVAEGETVQALAVVAPPHRAWSLHYLRMIVP